MKMSIKTTARIGGLLYLILILVGMFAILFIRNKLIVSGDAAATVHNIASSQLLWRLGIVADLIMHVLDVPIMLIIYIILKPVNKNLALLNLLFNLVQTAVLVANKLNLIAALLPLDTAEYLKTIAPHQLNAQVYLSLILHDYGFGVGLIFFGFVCLIEGYLIFRSGFLPKFIGVLMQIAGLCYLLNSFALLINPKFANKLFPFVMLPCFVAELSLSVWLIVKGINVTKWEEKANAYKLQPVV